MTRDVCPACEQSSEQLDRTGICPCVMPDGAEVDSFLEENAAAGTSATGTGDDGWNDPANVAALLEMFSENLDAMNKLVAKVDRLDERLCQLVVTEPVPKQKMADAINRALHPLDVRLAKLEALLGSTPAKRLKKRIISWLSDE